MGNPIFDRMNRQSYQTNSPANLIDAFNRFRSQFQGNAEQQVKNLVESGQMSQEQFNKFSGMARQFQAMFSPRG